MSRDTPVIFIVFNRPEVTAQVMARLREHRPARLYVVADGPRAEREGEAARCAEARAIATDVDWPCELRTDFSDTNLGCQQRVFTGISCVFEQEERAIILEDDCVPDPSFFPFCSELLERYADEPRVMQIAGTNQKPAVPISGDASYFYSARAHIWGWATWRRAWQHCDVTMADWPAFRDGGGMQRLGGKRGFQQAYAKQFDRVLSGDLDSWGYAWTFAMFKEQGLSVVPRVNLVSNIGFGGDATHTKDDADPLADIPSGSIDFPLRAPATIAACAEWDAAVDAVLNRGIAERAWRKGLRILRGLRS